MILVLFICNHVVSPPFSSAYCGTPEPKLHASIASSTGLLKIYKTFADLDKGSPEYKELALSGRVWEDHHQPGISELQGCRKLQQVKVPTQFE